MAPEAGGEEQEGGKNLSFWTRVSTYGVGGRKQKKVFKEGAETASRGCETNLQFKLSVLRAPQGRAANEGTLSKISFLKKISLLKVWFSFSSSFFLFFPKLK